MISQISSQRFGMALAASTEAKLARHKQLNNQVAQDFYQDLGEQLEALEADIPVASRGKAFQETINALAIKLMETGKALEERRKQANALLTKDDRKLSKTYTAAWTSVYEAHTQRSNDMAQRMASVCNPEQAERVIREIRKLDYEVNWKLSSPFLQATGASQVLPVYLEARKIIGQR